MKKVLLLMMVLCVSVGAKAQFPSSNEVYAYVRAGEKLYYVKLFFFNNNNVYFKSSYSHKIKEKYVEDPSLVSFFVDKNGDMKTSYVGVYKYSYDSNNSTYARTTYVDHYKSSQFSTEASHENYFSFSKDRKSLIIWHSNHDRKEYYTRVNLSEFAPKSQNKDFLYE